MASSKSLFVFFALFLALSSFAFAGNSVARPSTSGKLRLGDGYIRNFWKNFSQRIAVK